MSDKPRLAISACLLGRPCRYDGKSCYNEAAVRLADEYELIPICPECAGGLPTPRNPIEKREGKIVDRNGNDLTGPVTDGAKKTLEFLQNQGVSTIILQQRSPSCGCGKIYDGTFQSQLIDGDGVFTEMAKQAGMDCHPVETLSSC